MSYAAILLLVACLHQSISSEIKEVKTRWTYNDKNNNKNSLPDSIQMNFNLDDGDVEIFLNLTRQKTNSPLVMTQFEGERAIWKQPEDEVLGVYKDFSLDASATVTIKKVDDVEETLYMITFGLADTFYALGPSKKIIISFFNTTEEDEIETETSQLFNIDGTLHSLVEMSLKYDITDVIREERTNKNSDQTKKRLMTVKVFSVIDYSTFQKFFSESTATSDRDKREDAIKTILYVFTHIMEVVKDRYESIVTEDGKFTIKWVGALIAESVNDVSLFDNESSETDLPIQFDSSKSLDKLRRWTLEEPNKKIKLPTYDFLVAITSYKLMYGSEQITDATHAGSMCTSFNMGIVSHKQSFSTVSVLSHNLGDSLGMEEDLEHRCYPEGFIMSPHSNSYYYPLRFSNCSVSDLEKFIAKLDGSKMNCLDSTTPVIITTSPPSTLPTTTTTTISPTKIQTNSVTPAGTTSKGKPNSATPVTITVSQTSTISTTTVTTPYPSKATTFSLSSTVSSPTINPTKNLTDSCTEDFDGTLEYIDVWGDRLYLDCKSLVRHVSSLCYDDAVQKYCCASCKSVKMDKDYCINGDYKSKNFDCKQLVGNDPNHCGVKEFKTLCCKSCGSATVRNVELEVDH